MTREELQAVRGGNDAGGGAAGGDKEGFAGTDVHAVNKTGAGDADHNQEGIVQIYVHGLCEVVERGGEVLAAH